MNYAKIYNSIILRAKSRTPASDEYFESHHIIPRSIGGTNDITNLVDLTAREHFVCHYLLTKMYEVETNEWYRMSHAFLMMRASAKTHKSRYFNSRLYDSQRKNFSEVMSRNQSGDANSQFGTRWIYNAKLKLNKKLSVKEEVPPGWKVGRKLSWQLPTCKQCGNEFTPRRVESYCSLTCKQLAKKHQMSPSNKTYYLKELAARFNIIKGSIIGNEDFVRFALSNNVSKKQILNFLECNGSGANYITLKKLFKSL